jgi:cell division transport system permease protein
MSFASVCIIIAFLVIMGSFVLLAVNMNALIGDLESDNILLVYVHENLTESEARGLEHTLRAIPNVERAVFITREEAMDNFIGRYDATDRYIDVDPTWFRHRYAVYVEEVALIAETQDAVRREYGVGSVNANLAIASSLVSIRTVVSWVSVIIIAILLAISLFIISNTIKLATFERLEEIAIMKMVGATNSFIRWPFIFEGFILGLTGSLIAFATLWGLYGLIADRIQVVIFSSVSVPIFMLFTGIGIGVGVGGSGMALNRYLKV